MSTQPITFPAPIMKTLGIRLVKEPPSGPVTMEMVTDPATQANPMGTIHGGVLCDLADMAIGYTHRLTLAEGESFTSVDLKIHFFRPVWTERLQATAHVVHHGKTLSLYRCDITRPDGKTVATVDSTVMTLRGEAASRR